MKRGRVSQANIIAKECIVSALLQLIYEKPLTTITVSELTKRAGVSRMTFYRNYSSKEAIFSSHLEEILEMYWKESEEQKQTGTYYDRRHTLHCFEYLYKHRDFFEGLIYCGFGMLFLDVLTSYILKKWGENNDKYILVAFTGSLYNLFNLWSSNKYKDSLEDMASKIEKIYGNGSGIPCAESL